MDKGKIILVSICVSISVFLLGCKGSDGDSYLAYSWVSSPLYFYDENPSTPSTVYNGVYFSTGTGTYYMEYDAWDGSMWWMVYTITNEEGGLFGVAGDDSYFEITLYSSGPTLYGSSLANNIIESVDAREEEINEDTNSNVINKESSGKKLNRLPKEGTETITRNGQKLIIEYGRLEAE